MLCGRTLLVSCVILSAGCGSEGKLRIFPYEPDDDIAPVTTADPPGATLREMPALITLSTDEPAAIRFTLDGSDPAMSAAEESPVVIAGLTTGTVLRFFAVDPAGNAESLRTESYLLDRAAPAAITAFAAAAASSSVSLSWTNPADSDFAGVLVARSSGALWSPVDGESYEVGASLGGDTEILYLGVAEVFVETDLKPSWNRYGAWSFDGVRNYSRIAVQSANLPLPPQIATVTVNVAALTASVTGNTPHLALTAGTPSYAAGTMILTVPLTITNLAVRPVFNPKVVVASTSAGITFSNADPGAANGKPQRHFGPGALSGAVVSRSLTFANVGPAAMVTLGVQVVESPTTLFPDWGSPFSFAAGDGGTGAITNTWLASDGARGPGGGYNIGSAVMSADGRHVLAGGRNAARIERVDLATQKVAGGLSLAHAGAKANIGWMRLDASGRNLYVLLNDGFHRDPDPNTPTSGTMYLVRVDAETLQETARVELTAIPFGSDVRGRRFAISEAAMLAAIPIRAKTSVGRIAFVRLTDMTEVDTDPIAPGVQPLDTSIVGGASEVAFSPDGSTLYTNGTLGWPRDKCLIVDLSDYSITQIATSSPTSVAVGTDGSVFIGGWNSLGIQVYDPVSGGLSAVPGTAGSGFQMLLLLPSGNLLARSKFLQQEIDPDTGVVLRSWTLPDYIATGNWIVLSPF